MALQSDGKIVVAGTSGGLFVERLNANGSTDPGFCTGGVARAFGGSGAANGVAIQPDGEIVVVGSVNPIDTRIAVARFDANGRLDTSFGSGGSEVVDLGLPYAVAEGVAIQPDGGIVIVGHEQGSPNFAFFNGPGDPAQLQRKARPRLTHRLRPLPQGQQRIRHAERRGDAERRQDRGSRSDVGGPYAIFLRLNSNGSRDSGFGSSGEAALSSGTFTPQPVGAYGVAVARRQAVVGAGAVLLNGADHRAGLWALTASGMPEATFGSGSVVEQQNRGAGLSLPSPGSRRARRGHYRIDASNVAGSGTGQDATSTTAPATRGRLRRLPAPPTRSSEVSATVTGQVRPNGLPTTYRVEYGRTRS